MTTRMMTTRTLETMMMSDATINHDGNNNDKDMMRMTMATMSRDDG